MLKFYKVLVMKLLGNRYLIKKDNNNYTGKIILLENKFDMHPFSGEIVLVGNQIKSKKYNIGDRIFFTEFSYEVTDMMKDIDSENIYVFVNENDICAKILNDKQN